MAHIAKVKSMVLSVHFLNPLLVTSNFLESDSMNCDLSVIFRSSTVQSDMILRLF